jgi:hypothetical protein
MESDRTPVPERDGMIEPDAEVTEQESATPDPNDEIPVPIAMFPSEIDERAQVVEALREEAKTDREAELGL